MDIVGAAPTSLHVDISNTLVNAHAQLDVQP